MPSNLDKYKEDLKKLVLTGERLRLSLDYEQRPEAFKTSFIKSLGKEKAEEYLRTLPNVRSTYETWYSESMAVVKQLLPDRLQNFVGLYERPKGRKILDAESYKLQDYMNGLERSDGSVTGRAAGPLLNQQLAILRACEARFESSLFEMRQLVQADLFDSEIEAARALLKHGFGESGGSTCGCGFGKAPTPSMRRSRRQDFEEASRYQ